MKIEPLGAPQKVALVGMVQSALIPICSEHAQNKRENQDGTEGNVDQVKASSSRCYVNWRIGTIFGIDRFNWWFYASAPMTSDVDIDTRTPLGHRFDACPMMSAVGVGSRSTTSTTDSVVRESVGVGISWGWLKIHTNFEILMNTTRPKLYEILADPRFSTLGGL